MKGKKFIAIISIVCILAVILCIPAFATVTESNGNGYSLYGGYKLPNIDNIDVDTSIYPYINMFRIYVSGSDSYYYYLRLSTVQWVKDSNYSYLVPVSSGSCVDYSCITPYTTWRYLNALDISGSENENLGIFVPVYSNYDIVNLSDGSVYFSSSQSFNLSNYNVIEWDGDNVGLDRFALDNHLYIKLSDFSSAVNAVAAVGYFDTSHNERFFVDDFYSDEHLWYVNGDNQMIVLAIDDFAASSEDIESSGIYGESVNDLVGPLVIAYRTVEEPPNEGGDEPDDPQPPFWAAEIYLKLHLLALTPQLK